MDVPDLSQLKAPAEETPLLGDVAEAALTDAAMRTGILCSACGLVISMPGREYLSMRAVQIDGNPTVKVSRVYICGRSECDPAHKMAEGSAMAWRESGGWSISASVMTEEEEAEQAEAAPEAEAPAEQPAPEQEEPEAEPEAPDA